MIDLIANPPSAPPSINCFQTWISIFLIDFSTFSLRGVQSMNISLRGVQSMNISHTHTHTHIYIYIYIYILVRYTFISSCIYIYANKTKSDLSDKIKRNFFQAAVVSILLYGCTTWTLTKRIEKKLDGNYKIMLRAVINKSRK